MERPQVASEGFDDSWSSCGAKHLNLEVAIGPASAFLRAAHV